jgi:hypothetical protein
MAMGYDWRFRASIRCGLLLLLRRAP